MSGPVRRLFPAALVWLAAVGLHAPADEQPAPPEPRAAPRAGQSVFLDTDGAATKKLGAARDFLSASEWGDAIDLLRQIRDLHGQKLVELAPGRYVRVQVYCDLLLAGLPPDGLRQYRAKVDSQARQWFERGRQSRNEPLLRKVAEEAFLSSYGDDAVALLAELAWERGEFAAARSLWSKLVPRASAAAPGKPAGQLTYPDSSLDLASIRARLVLCSLLEGQIDRADAELAQFRQLHPQAQGQLAGRSGPLGEVLAAIADEYRKAPPTRGGSASFSTFAANVRRNASVAQAVDVGGPRWQIPLPDVSPDRSGPGTLSFYPVVYRDKVFFADDHAIYAYELGTGKPAWPSGDPGEVGAAAGRIFQLPEENSGVQQPRTEIGWPRFTVTIAGGRLFTRLGGYRANGAGFREATSYLACIDVGQGEGKCEWLLPASQLPAEGNAAEGSTWSFDGSPVVAGEQVFVALYRTRPRPQANVACFDAATGKLQWNRKVCVGVDLLNGESTEHRHQLLTLADDRLFFNTNMGVVACVDIRGNLQWAATYPRIDINSFSALEMLNRHGPNPCVYDNGQVFVAPGDSEQVFAFDAETGLLRWEHDTHGRTRALLGVGHGKLVAAGEWLVGIDVATGQKAWQWAAYDPESYTYGRGILAGDDVYWPTREELVIVSQDRQSRSRKPVDLVQKSPTGPQAGGGGNLVIAGGYLLVAQQRQLTAFCEYGTERKQHEHDISLRSDDPFPHFRLALIEQAAREVPAALEQFRLAVQHARPDDRYDDAPLAPLARQKLFALLIEHGAAAQAQKDHAAAVASFDEAARLPQPASDQLAALARLVAAQEGLARPEDAVATYQSLIENPALSGLRAPGSGRTPELVADWARREIARLIALHGRAVYAQVERQAQPAIAQAAAGRDLTALASVLQRYPHAADYEPQMLRLAGLQATAADLPGAAAHYRGVFDGPYSSATRQAAVLGLARLAERQKHYRTAAHWWQTWASDFPAAQIVEAGKTWPASQYVARQLALPVYHADLAAAEPGQCFPWKRHWQRYVPPGGAVVIPQGTSPAVALECVLLQSHTLQCLSAADGEVRWSQAVNERFDWAAYVGELLVCASPHRLVAVTLEKGDTVWEQSLTAPTEALPPEAAPRVRTPPPAAAAPKDSPPPAHSLPAVQAVADRLVARRGEQLAAFNGADGRLVWTVPLPPRASQALCLPDERTILIHGQTPPRVLALDAYDGRLISDLTDPSLVGRIDLPGLKGQFTLVSEPHRLECRHVASGTVQTDYRGPVSQTLLPPALLSNGADLCLLTDGLLLSRINLHSGEPVWTCRVGSDLVRDPARNARLDAQHAYVSTDGVLRCISLESGRLRWEQYLGSRALSWKCDKFGDYLVAYPRSAADRIPVIVLSADTGVPLQRLELSGSQSEVQLRLGSPVTVLHSGRELLGLGRL